MQNPYRRRLLRAALPALAWPALCRADAGALAPRVLRLAGVLARSTGLDARWVAAQLAQARYQPTVARLILPGRPMQKNWHVYRSHFVEPSRIDAGVAFARRHARWLHRARRRFGVPPAVLLGILGVETLYGRQMGHFRVLDALTTLSLDYPAAAVPDRSAFFTAQLGDFLRWCHVASIAPDSVRGSYAGAIGMPQFMPGSILRWGVSARGGAAADLVDNAADAIASIANFLAGHGWIRNVPASFALPPPDGVDPATLQRLLAPDIVPSFGAGELRAAGLRLPPAALTYPGKLAVVRLPNGDAPPSYRLGTVNFFVVTRYNHSALYAQAVLDLGAAVENALRSERLSA